MEKMENEGTILANLQTRCWPSSPTAISALPPLTRNDRAKIFSTVCANDVLFKIRLSNLTHLIFLNMLNIVDMFLSISFFPSVSV